MYICIYMYIYIYISFDFRYGNAKRSLLEGEGSK